MYCDFCDKIFQNKIDLCSHMSLKHSEHFVKKETKNVRILEEVVKNSETVAKVELTTQHTSEPEANGGKQCVNKQESEEGGEKVKVKLNYILDELEKCKGCKK